jgi:antitoxin component YwqK of YwqJK toxin-antitoxin module
LLFAQACSIKNNIENKNPYPASIDTILNVVDTALLFHVDTLYYKDKKFTGTIFKLYPNLETAFIGHYLNGLEDGLQKKWYPNKQLLESRLYSQGKKIGKHIGYWEKGNIKFEYYFKNGEHEGVLNEWYQGGQRFKEFHYKNGYEEGSEKMWWENGTIRANYVVKNGRRYGLIGLKLCMNPIDSMK